VNSFTGHEVIYKLSLYVTPSTPNSQRAISNLNALCRENLPVRFDVEVIDVTRHPALAARDNILATPTLVRRTPKPIRKIIGDLSDRERVLLSLDLQPNTYPRARSLRP
jgi:circadian clock protein KaiB